MLQAGRWAAVFDGGNGRRRGGWIRHRHCDHSARGTRIENEVSMKPLIVLTLLAIVASLGKALFSMSSGPEHSARVVQALSWRIGLSVALFVSVLLSYHFGWSAPHILRGGRHGGRTRPRRIVSGVKLYRTVTQEISGMI